MEAQKVKIVDGGKLVIPASMRRTLGLGIGDTVLVDIEDGELRVRSVSRAIDRARAILRQHTLDDSRYSARADEPDLQVSADV